MFTFNNILTKLESFQTSHKQLNSFLFGQQFIIGSTKKTNYPMLFCELAEDGSITDERIEYFNLDFMVLDTPNAKNDHKRGIQEILSDTKQIANDLIAYLKYTKFTEGTLNITLPVSMQPLISITDDASCGWSFTLNIKLPNQLDLCGIPISCYTNPANYLQKAGNTVLFDVDAVYNTFDNPETAQLGISLPGVAGVKAIMFHTGYVGNPVPFATASSGVYDSTKINLMTFTLNEDLTTVDYICQQVLCGQEPTTTEGSSYTPTMQNYLTRLSSEGGTLTDAEKGYLNTLTLNPDIGEFDRLWVHGLSNQIAARISLVNALTADLLTEVNSPTWDIDGYSGNSVNMYLNTNFNPFVDSVKFTQNSSSFGSYFNTPLQSGKIQGALIGLTGCYLFDNTINICPSNNDNNDDPSNFTTNKDGLIITTRDNSASKNVWIDGVESADIARVSNGVPNGDIYLLAWNVNGVATSFGNQKISASFIGSGAIDQAQFYTDIQTLGTSLGWAV